MQDGFRDLEIDVGRRRVADAPRALVLGRERKVRHLAVLLDVTRRQVLCVAHGDTRTNQTSGRRATTTQTDKTTREISPSRRSENVREREAVPGTQAGGGRGRDPRPTPPGSPRRAQMLAAVPTEATSRQRRPVSQRCRAVRGRTEHSRTGRRGANPLSPFRRRCLAVAAQAVAARRSAPSRRAASHRSQSPTSCTTDGSPWGGGGRACVSCCGSLPAGRGTRIGTAQTRQRSPRSPRPQSSRRIRFAHVSTASPKRSTLPQVDVFVSSLLTIPLPFVSFEVSRHKPLQLEVRLGKTLGPHLRSFAFLRNRISILLGGALELLDLRSFAFPGNRISILLGGTLQLLAYPCRRLQDLGEKSLDFLARCFLARHATRVREDLTILSKSRCEYGWIGIRTFVAPFSPES